MTLHKPKYKRVLFIPDIHAPYHDPKALKAFLAFAKWYKPDVVFYLGDLVDFYAISSFAKDPTRALKLQDEIDSAVDIISKIDKVVNGSQKYFIKGNHEARLQKYLWTKASELSGLRDLRVDSLLRLNDFGITYVDNGRMKFRGMVIKHGDLVRKFGAYTARGEFESTGMSGVSAHTHRLAMYPQSNEAGDFVWFEAGCLCKLDAEYMNGKVPNWQQGFGIGYYKAGSRRFHLERVPIIGGKAMYGGMEFR